MANQDPALDLTPAQFRALDERRKTAWIGSDIVVKGDLICTRSLTIDGRVDGTIEVGDNALTIGEGATVNAHLVARVVTIGGLVTGNVTARERVDLRATGSVDGNIKSPRFAMAEGSVVRGSIEVG